MISVDDLETNKKFAAQEEADFPMLSDPARTVADAYGVLPPANPARPDAPRTARRWTFYIGPDGRILYIDREVHTSTAGKDLADRLEALGVKKK
jgi:thioredoxin-dependent peroxiredoxin